MNIAPLLERPVLAISRSVWWRRPPFPLILLLTAFSLLSPWFTVETVTARGFLHLAVPFFLASALLGHTPKPDILNEEQRAGTISLLFLARIRPLDLIAARFLSALLHGGRGALGVAPWLVLGLGARPDCWAAVGRLGLAWGTLFWLAGSLSLFAATFGRHRKQAAGGFLGSWWLLLQFGPLLATALRKANLPSPLIRLFELGNPAAMLQAFWWAADASVPPGFYPTLGLIASVAFGSTLSAWVILRRKWGAGFAGGSGLRHRGGKSGSGSARRRLGDQNPIAWLSRDGSHRLLWLVNLACLSVMAAQPLASLDTLVIWTNVTRGVLMASLCLLTFRTLERDWRNGAFELIYVSGLSDSELQAGYRRTAWRQVAGPWAVVTVANALWPLLPGAPGMSAAGLAAWMAREAAATWLGGWLALEISVDTVLNPKTKDASRWQFGLLFGGSVGFLNALTYDHGIGIAGLDLGILAAVFGLRYRRYCGRLRELWRERSADQETGG